MKLKSSNKQQFIFLLVLITGAVLLLILSNFLLNKKSKYAVTPNFEQKSPLDFIQLTFNQNHYNKLKKKRDKALSIGILETKDSDYVPVTVSYNGKDFKAEARLKGDWTDHLSGDKWSFRIKLKNDKTILGMRKFSLHHPKTRGYINEWLYHKTVKSEDLIGLKYSFVEGSIHIKQKNTSSYINKSLGIYAIEETFDKRTIESNKRKESVILKFSENYWWNEVKKAIKTGEPYGIGYNKFMKRVNYPVNAFSESKILQDSTMKKYFILGKSLLKGAREGHITLSDAFDVKKLAMHNALLNLFGANHGNSIINIRFYYNPITSKLEPIAFDGNAGKKLQKYESFNFIKNNNIKDSIYDKELIVALHKISKPSYVDQLIKTNKAEVSNFKNILKKEFNINSLSITNLKHNQNILREELSKLSNTYNIKNLEPSKQGLVTEIKIPNFSSWIKSQTRTETTSLSYKGKKALKLSRKNILNSAFNVVNNIEVNYGKEYEASFVVKKDKNSLFGLRIQGGYPNRVDAVFDIKKGVLKGVKKAGNFENEKASIKYLGNGWYKCILSGKINASDIRIIFGSTNDETNVLSWESKTKNITSITIIPQSLSVNQVRE